MREEVVDHVHVVALLRLEARDRRAFVLELLVRAEPAFHALGDVEVHAAVAAVARVALDVVDRAVVGEVRPEALAGVEGHRHLGLEGWRLHVEPAVAVADEGHALAAQSGVYAGLVVVLGEAGGGLVVHRREELLRRKVVDVVLAVVEDLLEAVPVAERLRGGALPGAREHVGGKVVQRPALEAAVAVEHDHGVAAGAVRTVRAGVEVQLVVHEIVGRLKRILEDYSALTGDAKAAALARSQLAGFLRSGMDAGSVVADPLFVDPEHGDWTLRPESPALKLGFKPFDWTRAGVLKDDPDWVREAANATYAPFKDCPPAPKYIREKAGVDFERYRPGKSPLVQGGIRPFKFLGNVN